MVVRGHHARAQQRAGGRHRRMDRDVHVDPGLVQRLPQEHRLPVVPDDDRNHGRDDLGAVCQPGGFDDLEAELTEPAMQVARIVEHLCEQLASLVGPADADRGKRRARRRRDRRCREHERPRLDAQKLDHVGRARDHAAARGQRLRERGHPQVDLVRDAEQLGSPGAAPAQNAEGVGLIDHQARAELAAELDDLGQRRHVALHREDSIDDHEYATAVGRCLLERALEPVDAVVAKRP